LKVLVVGAGAAGQVVCTHLARAPDLEVLKIADKDVGKARKYADWLKSDKVSTYRVDATDANAVAKLARGVDVLVNALEPIFNLNLMRAALYAGVDYQDLAFGPPYDTLAKMLKQDAKWKRAGRIALTCTGNSPGITNIVASKVAEEFDAIEGIEIRVFSRLNSTETISTWSTATMIQDMKEEPVIYEDGRFKRAAPFSGEETYTFPDPVGPQLLSYHVHEEPHTLPRFINKGIKYVGFKYGVNPLMRGLFQVGLLGERPIKVKGAKVRPLDVVIACYPQPITMEELRTKIQTGVVKGSVGCSAVEVWGEKDAKPLRRTQFIIWPDIVDISKTMPHATHTSYMAGTGAAILTEALARGQIETKGVVAPECLEQKVRESFLAELPRRQISLKRTEAPKE